MEALDLTKAPPRGTARAARRTSTSSWLRAPSTRCALRYPAVTSARINVPGFSAQMLEAIGISEDDFRGEVARASSDADIAAWLRGQTTPEKIAAFNEKIQARRIKHRLMTKSGARSIRTA